MHMLLLGPVGKGCTCTTHPYVWCDANTACREQSREYFCLEGVQAQDVLLPYTCDLPFVSRSLIRITTAVMSSVRGSYCSHNLYASHTTAIAAC